jgi:hypothetical protein
LDYGVKITLSKQISKELLYPIKLIFILLCADWSAWEFQEGTNEISLYQFFKMNRWEGLTISPTSVYSLYGGRGNDFGMK